MQLTITINGVEKNIRMGSLDLARVTNGQDSLVCSIPSEGGSYIPDCGQSCVVEDEDDNVLFGGLIEHVEVGEIGEERTQGTADVQTRIEATGYTLLASRRSLNGAVASKTLEDFLDDDILPLLAGYGVVKHPDQSVGPTLAAVENYIDARVDEVLSEICSANNLFWKIDGEKQLRVWAAGEIVAPVELNNTDSRIAIGDVRLIRSRKVYGNRVVGFFGPSEPVEVTEHFVGDGSTTVFNLKYTVAHFWTMSYPDAVPIQEEKTIQDYGPVGAATWYLDRAAKTVTAIAAPANGENFYMRYLAAMPFRVEVNDLVDQGLNGIIDQPQVKDDKVTSYDRAVEILTTQLQAGVETEERIEYRTQSIHLFPGMVQDADLLETRPILGEYLLTEVTVRQDFDGLVTADVGATGGDKDRGTFRETYNRWAKIGGGAATAAYESDIITTGSGPFGPENAVQRNNGGRFYGDSNMLFTQSTKSLTAGRGCTIDESAIGCQAFGDDCHIGGSW